MSTFAAVRDGFGFLILVLRIPFLFFNFKQNFKLCQQQKLPTKRSLRCFN
jgi:hypothetical protein